MRTPRATLLLASLLAGARLGGQARVEPVFSTPARPEANVDSCAVWVAPASDPPGHGDSLLFVTEKDGDRIQVWEAATGRPYAPRPFLGGVPDGSGPGEFDRPNGVWVIYHVPCRGGFADILLVTDQRNLRLQIFRLPELETFGELGSGQIGKGYGIAWYHDGSDFYVYVTDNIPPESWPGKIKKYRLRPEGSGLSGDLIFGTGAAGGDPPLPNVESILADSPLDRLHLSGDEGGRFNRLFRLDGSYTGIAYGDPQFEADQEGINLYDTGGGEGYLVISDQIRGGEPNEFELFDRVTLESLGNFTSRPGGALVTSNTDGAFLEQRPLAGLPNGAFYAVHDDRSVHAYDWTDIAGALGLEIVALDRPFAVGSPDPARTREPSRAVLWFHDGSWWGAFPEESGLALRRLEDGTFRRLGTAGMAGAAAARVEGGRLVLLAAGAPPQARSFQYDPSQRRWEPLGEPAAVTALSGARLDLALEPGGGGGGRLRAASAEGGEVRLTWAEDAASWDPAGLVLGAALDVPPRLVRLEGATGIAWAAPEGISFRLHRDGDPPAAWSPPERAAAGTVAELAAAALADGSVLVVGATAAGEAALGRRDPGGAWSGASLEGEVRAPALLADPGAELVHLVHIAERGGHRLLYRREARLDDLAAGSGFGAGRYLLGWPGVEPGGPLVAALVPPEAPEIVAALLGDDGRGYFARWGRPGGGDRLPPVTSQHSPPPGATVGGEVTISFRVTDDLSGVDRSRLRLLVNEEPLALELRGVPRNLLARATLPAGLGPRIDVRIEARDLAPAPHEMHPFAYSFFLEGPGVAPFRRGDPNGDGSVDLADAVRILRLLFVDPASPACPDAADANDDGRLNLADPLFLLEFLFRRGPPLGGPGSACGWDPTPDGLACEGGGGCG